MKRYERGKGWIWCLYHLYFAFTMTKAETLKV